MLERNILSHFKLALLLSLLSSAVLLHARLPTPMINAPNNGSSNGARIPVAAVHLIAALAVIGAGVWEYWSGNKDLRDMRAFLVLSK